MIAAKKRGFTFIEVCMSILILSLVFGVAAGIMSYSRKESEKGRWIQQSLGMLRNATRQIGDKLKEKSYPSTLVANRSATDATKFNQIVISFKERREYDSTGRLRFMEVNDSNIYEIFAATNGGLIAPTDMQILLMYFPICTPEKDFQSDYTPGLITWVRFVLEPAADFEYTKRGKIVMEEYEANYDTREYEIARAYKLDDPFNIETAKLKRKKEIITDVSGVQIKSFEMSSSRGSYVDSKSGSRSEDFKQIKNIINFKIYCTHPKDDKVKLTDTCSVTANSEVIPL